jgi:tetratricopeptide (TPR) repeat protein
LSESSSSRAVKTWSEPLTIPTYLPLPPDRNPMFLQRRVYQGSSGKVYPLPFHDRIAENKTPYSWDAIYIENDFLHVTILPQLGGRIHRATDKSNGYDLIYHQEVIKPALVGLAGPWISGGIEFNWPQHHRPATFMPCEAHIEEHPDGGKTVWLGDHEPMNRMKGMHGVCLHPDKAYIELKVRLCNRTAFTQSFLWWANVATRVHERYQSFFPPDVHYVVDHAKRATSGFPLCTGRYYGVDYGKRARHGVPAGETPRGFVPPPGTYAPNDLSWYANIPVPTSYMCMGTNADFFGGYDHAAQAGIVHVASHHISPGKKQWTWGNHEFGYAWDRNLTDADENGVYHPYIELMAGVFTDNQPDFSFLAPGETRAFSQFWYPIRKIGPAHKANIDAAVSLAVRDGNARAGVAVTSRQNGAMVRLLADGEPLAQWAADLSPSSPLTENVSLPAKTTEMDLTLVVTDRAGRELIHYRPAKRTVRNPPPAADEPPMPKQLASGDELYLTGLHLEQYRHATRAPEAYWLEALKRDPLDSRCNHAMGLWHLRRGEFAEAEARFRNAIARLTRRNPNPLDGEPHYHLGLTQRYLGRDQEAYAALYKSTWNAARAAAAFHAIAELDCRRGDWTAALTHLDLSLKHNADDLRARDLKAIVLRKLGREDEAAELLGQTLQLDPLDWWACYLIGKPLTADTQIRLDLTLDFERAGLFADAIELLRQSVAQPGTAPLIEYYLGFLHERAGQTDAAQCHYTAAAKAPADYCFPARLEEIAILESVMRANLADARAPYYLGNLFYDRGRHREAIQLWQRSAKLDPDFSTVWRNLGIGYFNILHRPRKARAAYDKAVRADLSDARLIYERDQLCKRLGDSPRRRLANLRKHLDLVRQRDDLTIELCTLYNQTRQPDRALQLLSGSRFQPWEGGEGLALGQHVRAHLALGRRALALGRPARGHFENALASPENLGEAKHLLANQSDIHYWLGVACKAEGDGRAALRHWKTAADFRGDFQEMSVRVYSEMTYFSALSMERLGKRLAARRLLRELRRHAKAMLKTRAKTDYFATSLQTMLLSDDDLQQRQTVAALVMMAQAELGLGRRGRARKLFGKALGLDPNHALAADLLNDLDIRRE